MPKRVSLKGKGAELFFGEFPAAIEADAEAAAPQVPAEQQLEAAASQQEAALAPSSPSAPITASTEAKPATRARTSRAPVRAKGAAGQSVHALPSVDTSAVEAIRQVIKVPGREVSYVRMTPEEKAQLSDIVYTYKRQGQKTSENELNRIAINYLLLDYHEHGEQSVLARVLAALLA
jgi:hypothetical protein